MQGKPGPASHLAASWFSSKEVLEVLAELDGGNPFFDCVTGKRGHVKDTSIVEATKRPSGDWVRSNGPRLRRAADAKTAAREKLGGGGGGGGKEGEGGGGGGGGGGKEGESGGGTGSGEGCG